MVDPLHSDILEALAALPPDRNDIFERCMGDLLAQEFPGLVPVRGGHDAGMDLAVPDPEGAEPYPGVCTISQDVIGNLTKSLKSWRADHPEACRALVATSQPLSQRKRANLHRRAQELGFRLVQIVDRAGVANRLYRSPRWLRELLNLSGELPALSILPPRARAGVGEPLIGRDADLARLRALEGDLVVVGQPGSGKSALLHHLAREGWGLFASTEDEERLAGAIRASRPARIIVDDAHVAGGQLALLARYRRETEANFSIVASTWPSLEDDVAASSDRHPQTYRLELLTREEIREIYLAMGLDPSNGEWMRFLIDLAANKPGLASAIGSLVMAGRATTAGSIGEELRRHLRAPLRDLAGTDDAEVVLSAFAVGGRTGMTLEGVATGLSHDPPWAWRIATSLAAGGALEDRGDGTLRVEPWQLRLALIAHVFYPTSRPPLPIANLLQQATDRAAAIEAIAGSIHFGASIPRGYLHSLVMEGDAGAWAWLAADREHVDWVIEAYPGPFVEVAREALSQGPSAALARLLAEATAATDAGERKDVFETIRSWAREIPDGDDAVDRVLDRRRLLAKTAVELCRKDPAGAEVAAAAARWALSPGLERTGRDPAAGTRLSWQTAVLPPRAIEALRELQQNALALIASDAAAAWPQVDELLRSWEYLQGIIPSTLPPEHLEAGREFAREIVLGLWLRVPPHPGVLSELKVHAEALDLPLPPREGEGESRLFDLIFPQPSQVEEDEVFRASADRLDAITREVAGWPADRLFGTMRDLASQAFQVGRGSGFQRDLWRACGAAAGEDLVEWILTGLELGVGEPFLVTALEQLVASRPPRWEELLTVLIQRPTLSGAAVTVGLAAQDLPPDLENLVIAHASAVPRQQLVLLCASGAMPPPRQVGLLEHPDAEVRLTAAVGASHAIRRGHPMPRELKDPWRRAVISSATLLGESARSFGFGTIVEEPHIGSSLASILRADLVLAEEWLNEYIRLTGGAGYLVPPHSTGPVDQALRALESAQRVRLVALLRGRSPSSMFVARLVGSDREAFSALLADPSLVGRHAAPLQGGVRRGWAELARLAVAAGVPHQELASETLFGSGWGYSGSGVEYWEARREEVRAACADDPTLVGLRDAAVQMIEAQLLRARDEERKIALHGLR